MHAASDERLEAGEQAFIDQVVAGRAGRPGALLSILEAVQNHNPHNYLPMDALRYVAAKTECPYRRSIASRRSMRFFNLQSAGRQHDLHLPRNGLPYARIAQSAGKPCGWTWGWERMMPRTPAKPTRFRSPRRTASSRYARWPALGNARWRRWSKSITAFAGT